MEAFGKLPNPYTNNILNQNGCAFSIFYFAGGEQNKSLLILNLISIEPTAISLRSIIFIRKNIRILFSRIVDVNFQIKS
jgi:hypothetical protein